ncbi:MAG TPA: Stp1/IreP family PP2C-type Ser/Thr phosphatase [Epulopiscium sp.]|nr:Stp1/IreP family PP2C-type Ser/Thr phosphatase [Candidatus Epulonipiscium sp.]
MIAVGKTDIGKKRVCNEDAFFVTTQKHGPLPNIYIVADGMGGHKAGYYASHAAIQFICEFMVDHAELVFSSDDDIVQFLKRAISHANYQLFQQANTNPDYKGMGTTLTISTVINEMLYTAHVGDSRLYIINNETMCQVTQDHSLVQEMVENGYISELEAKTHPKRHIITRAVGTYEKVKVDTYSSSLEGVQYIFLCSDGVTTMLSDGEIHTIIIGDEELEYKVDTLISFANDRGGIDNITVVLAIYDKVVKMC